MTEWQIVFFGGLVALIAYSIWMLNSNLKHIVDEFRLFNRIWAGEAAQRLPQKLREAVEDVYY